ncbi:MAG: DNA mismatch repair protein MutS [Anaerolineae bacterium]|nr:DNA mismatch repair protein MutS [Anaerolineae bacterium]MDH7473958.1 DNA mismatch repair protein MutS [Anaerolineae bacterium]
MTKSLGMTPLRRQYLQIKKQYPDAIVFFRLGDFYETFDEDAKIVSQTCDIVLTSRPVGKDQRVPLAGVPYHAVDGYIARLIQSGHKVAIVEQVGEIEGRTLMHREVTRMVTPGTVVEPVLLEDKRNNYLAAVVRDDERAGLAYVDITTGEFATTQLTDEDIARLVREELERLQPAEVLVPAADKEWLREERQPAAAFHVTPYEDWRFELGNARRSLLDHFGVASLAGFGCEGLPLAVRAAGAIIQYLQETQRAGLGQLDSLHTYSTSEFMTLDAATRRNLELTETIRERTSKGSLLGVLDATVTAMGGRVLRQWINQPLLNLTRLNERLDAVQALYDDTPARSKLIALLKGLPDLERLTNRVVQRIAGPRDLLGIRRALEAVPRLKEVLAATTPLDSLVKELDPCTEVASLIGQAIADDPPATLTSVGVIRPGFSAELDGVIMASRDAKEWVANLERSERQRTGIKSLKVGYNKVFGYYIEVTKANLDAVPAEYIRKQTLVNAERFITPELKEYESLILNAEERILDIESRLFREVCDQVAVAAPRMLRTARVLAQLDVYAALAEVALRNRYTRPLLTEQDVLEIKAGRHPVVELFQRDEPFVPNDVRLNSGERILVITGPNMSGKSTFLRQVALIVLMAQIGSFVPADAATIGLVDRIFTRVGAQDELAAGRSTFMVEMVETANILHHATARSLIILDEIGRGTSTYDGISIAWAVVEYIHNHPRLQAKTLFATHYHELTDLANILPLVRNYNVAVAEEGDRVVFLRKVVPGGADKSYGIHVAQLAGLPRSVIHRAEEILSLLEREASRSPGKARHPVEVLQLPLFTTEHPVLDELKTLDVTQMTPLEAITKLYELQKRVKEG